VVAAVLSYSSLGVKLGGVAAERPPCGSAFGQAGFAAALRHSPYRPPLRYIP